MHTILDTKDGTWVGMWLPNAEGVVSFVRMFEADSVIRAVRLAHYLNGGENDHLVEVEDVLKHTQVM